MRVLFSLPITAIAVGFAVVSGNYAEAGNAAHGACICQMRALPCEGQA
jgi:hypothetical protein